MSAELSCIEQRCRARFPITEILYNCPKCGSLLEAVYGVEGFVGLATVPGDD